MAFYRIYWFSQLQLKMVRISFDREHLYQSKREQKKNEFKKDPLADPIWMIFIFLFSLFFPQKWNSKTRQNEKKTKHHISTGKCVIKPWKWCEHVYFTISNRFPLAHFYFGQWSNQSPLPSKIISNES